jgi:hypothetical protein
MTFEVRASSASISSNSADDASSSSSGSSSGVALHLIAITLMY